MYGLSQDVNLNFLVGQHLIQLGVGQNEIIMNFYDNTSITLECGFSVKSDFDETRVDRSQSGIIAATAIWPLVGRGVTMATSRDSGTLRLEFGYGFAIEIYDDSSKYESYQIKHPGGIIVV